MVTPIVSTKAIRDPRLAWFREARFGMFVHFGVYALLGRGEWVQYKESIPREEYERLMTRFDPSRFDADEWIDVAESAGCRYITVTAKHHDGFCLFDSALTEYKITNTPFGRDLIGELIDGCHRRKMRICLYYSQPDWHHPNFVNLRGAFKDLDHPPATDRPDWDAYLAYCHGQVRELCGNYGRIDGIWFDGSHKSEATWRGRALYRMIKRLQPGAIVNDRARFGDMYTPERSLPEDLTGFLFEACETIAKFGWGYHGESPQATVPELVDNLARVAGAGGNFLLNVGPLPDGRIRKVQAERMRDVGAWMRTNGEAIYGTRAFLLRGGPSEVVATARGTRVYVILRKWPTYDSVTLPGIGSAPRRATLLGTKARLAVHATADGVAIDGLPASPPSALPQVVRLDFAAAPRVPSRPREPKPATVDLAQAKTTVLSVAQGVANGRGVKGSRVRVVERPSPIDPRNASLRHVTRNWFCETQELRWSVRASRSGERRVRILLTCPEPFHGSEFEVRVGKRAITGRVEATPRGRFVWQSTGALRFVKGVGTLSLRPVRMPYGYIFAEVAALSVGPA